MSNCGVFSFLRDDDDDDDARGGFPQKKERRDEKKVLKVFRMKAGLEKAFGALEILRTYE